MNFDATFKPVSTNPIRISSSVLNNEYLTTLHMQMENQTKPDFSFLFFRFDFINYYEIQKEIKTEKGKLSFSCDDDEV